MTNTRIIFFSILIAVLLAILVMWCADVLAHSDGNPQAHFAPYTTQDPCWGNDCNDADFIGGHGHIDAYDDENGNDSYRNGINSNKLAVAISTVRYSDSKNNHDMGGDQRGLGGFHTE